MEQKYIAKFLGGVVLLSVVCFAVPAVSGEFSAVVQNQDGTTEMLYVKGNKYRVEGKAPAGVTLAIISDRGSKKFYLLNLSAKEYVPVPVSNPMVAASFPFEIAHTYREMAKDTTTPYRIKSEGSDTVAGQGCEKLLVIFDGGGMGNHELLRQCVSQELDFPIKIVVPPEQSEMVQEFNLELTNIKEDAVADDLFSLPEGYKMAKE